jgi:hypothetical protein
VLLSPVGFFYSTFKRMGLFLKGLSPILPDLNSDGTNAVLGNRNILLSSRCLYLSTDSRAFAIDV